MIKHKFMRSNRVQKVSHTMLALLLCVHCFLPGEIFSPYAFLLLIIYLVAFKFNFPLPNIGLYYLIAIVIIGMIFGVQNGFKRDYFRDTWQFAKPVYMAYFGAILGSKYNLFNLDKVFRLLIIAGVISALWHFAQIATVPGFMHMSLQDIRDSLGRKSSMVEVIAMGLIIYAQFKYKRKLFSNLMMWGFLFIIFVSTILFVSRTSFLLTFVYLGFLFDYYKFSIKSIVAILAVVFGLFYIFSLNDSTSGTSGWLLQKIKNAPAEILFSQDETNDKQTINQDWRGYEALMVVNQTLQAGTTAVFIGNGFGALVDLHMDETLDGVEYSKIPQVHNGYAQVFFKAGLVGLTIYFIWIITLYVKIVRIRNLPQQFLIMKKIALGSVISILFTSVAVTGIYNIHTLDSVLIITFFSYMVIKRYSVLSKKLDADYAENKNEADYNLSAAGAIA